MFIAKLKIRSVLFAVILIAVATSAYAQEPAATAIIEQPDFIYKVEHDHGIGSGKGELRITDEGVEYRGESEDEVRHNHVWRDQDIKRFEIKQKKMRVVVYEAASILLIPRKAPFTDGRSVRVGNEREYTFRLRDSEITADVVRELLARFNRPIATTIIPNRPEESGILIFEIPVFHRHRAGGESGLLRVYEHHVIFEADTEDHSRHWRYDDIRDIGRLGRYKFEIATYEGQFGSDGKSYVFDLKRPMTEAEFDSLWKRLYERDPALQPRKVPRQDKLPSAPVNRERVSKQ
jgi:hypothetical protein